ncbi:MAG: ribonuclease P protein component [Candidatus Pacebacteria bacterium]|nr:ribonuclease P protein component [Candidatus Paceibacterota bacterium]
MLSKPNRLKQKKDIERVIKKGENFKEKFLVLKTAKNNLSQSRFGFIVSQKVSKKASTRNKFKREMREIVRKKIKSLKTGRDNLFITLPGTEKKKFPEIEETITTLFKKANL